MTPRRLRWIALAGLVGLVVSLELVRDALYPLLLSWPARLLMAAMVVLGMLGVYAAAVRLVEGMQAKLLRRNRELETLYRAGIAIAAELDLESVLDKIVTRARELVEARYGALAVYDEDDRLVAFLTSGVDRSIRERIGSLPRGHGLLGVKLREGEALRLSDLNEDPRFEGFPAGHPPMHSLLAVPVAASGGRRGTLYVAEKRDGAGFTIEDESTLRRFAAQAAVAASNARLHRQVRDLAVSEERIRIAHEMHDGLAQVLAYVNAKLQAVRQHVVAGDGEQAIEQLDQLALAAREAYSDVREGILDLRAARTTDGAFPEMIDEYVRQWSEHTGITVRLQIGEGVDPPASMELQLIRILQEALANVRKHAEATGVELVVQRGPESIRLAIRDDGLGFDPSRPRRGGPPRFGLATMRERAEAIGAEFRLDSRPGAGTQVSVRVPVAARSGMEGVDARAHR
jgi:nitrate/nitrite-specific signal transduction histidine kinase